MLCLSSVKTSSFLSFSVYHLNFETTLSSKSFFVLLSMEYLYIPCSTSVLQLKESGVILRHRYFFHRVQQKVMSYSDEL